MRVKVDRRFFTTRTCCHLNGKRGRSACGRWQVNVSMDPLQRVDLSSPNRKARPSGGVGMVRDELGWAGLRRDGSGRARMMDDS